MSNINTLGSLSKKREEGSGGSSSDEEGQQAFYAGGSERGSGQQILGPNDKKRNPNELIAEMFKAAREAGAQVLDRPEDIPSGSNSSSRRPNRVFSGAGHTLGTTATAAAAATAQPSQTSSTASGLTGRTTPEQCFRKLKMWRNGFSVDEGELRSYQDPANAEFLACIQRGEVPRELIAAAKGGEVNLNMEDHRTEEYVTPKRKVQSFAGEGHRLGNVTAAVATPVELGSGEQAKKSEEEARQNLKLDETKPTTVVQVRLADGSRLTIKVNLNHTISALRTYICTARPTYSASPFILMTTFPNVQLEDESLTIEDAKLQNAVVVQRLQ